MSRNERLSYTPYGFSAPTLSAKAALGFNGEYLQAQMSLYMLGFGYRSFSPSLHRFHSADVLSPFSTGGLNAYAYCSGDPVNRIDPTGHSGLFIRLIKGTGNMLGFRSRRKVPTNIVNNVAQINRAAFNASESLTYSSVNSTGSGGSISSGYANVNSYSSVSSANALSLPHRPPPSSGGTSSHFSINNPDRMPTGREVSDIQDWVNNHSTSTDQQLREFAHITRAGAKFHRKYLNVINAGIRRSADYQLATKTPRVPTMYQDGRIFTWRDRSR